MSVKKNDMVRVTTGKDKGKEGQVLEVNDMLIKVQHINLKVHHTKARKAGEKSAIRSLEGYISHSNVMPLCPSCKKPCRTKASQDDSKNKRSCNRCHVSF